jgi:AraC-like DNA-binding protein
VRRVEFRSRDLDETRNYIRPRYGEHSRVAQRRGPYLYGFVAAASQRVTLARSRVSAQTVRGATSLPTLVLPLTGEDTYRIGRRTLLQHPGCAVLAAPGHEYTVRIGGDNPRIHLMVSRELLEQAIALRRAGRTRAWCFRSVEIPMDDARRAWLQMLTIRMHALADPRQQATGGEALQALEGEIAAWLAGLLLEQADERVISTAGIDRVRQLERWIDAHLDEDLSLDRLCAVAGVRWRALQTSLLLVRGMTPLEFVASRRLAAARALLESSAADLTVSRTAMDCGFVHLGRFSSAYRKAFGESPSDTLARTRQRSAPFESTKR